MFNPENDPQLKQRKMEAIALFTNFSIQYLEKVTLILNLKKIDFSIIQEDPI